MGAAGGCAGYRGEDSRGRKGCRVSLLPWNETLVRRRKSARRVQSGRLRSVLEEDARFPGQQATIIRWIRAIALSHSKAERTPSRSPPPPQSYFQRSEERRVGKECRSGGTRE